MLKITYKLLGKWFELFLHDGGMTRLTFGRMNKLTFVLEQSVVLSLVTKRLGLV
jgi:hypothetical protein